MCDGKSQTEIERRIDRHSLRIEQVRLHLQALCPETFEARKARQWLRTMLLELSHLRAERDLLAVLEGQTIH
jgi:hypothetical protein